MHFEIKTDTDYNFSKSCQNLGSNHLTLTFCDLMKSVRVPVSSVGPLEVMRFAVKGVPPISEGMVN